MVAEPDLGRITGADVLTCLRLSPIRIAKRVSKPKMATFGHYSSKNTALTELLNRVAKMSWWREGS
jgi:hypothetical protein